VSRMLRSLALMKEPVKRETYIQYLSQQARIGDRTLFEELGQLISRHNRDARIQQTREDNENARSRFRDGDNESRQALPTAIPAQKRASEKEVLRIMLSYGKPLVEFIGSFSNADHFEDPELKALYVDLIKTWEEDGDISISAYTEKSPPIPSIVSEIVVDRHSVSDNSAKKLGKIPQRDVEPYAAAQGALKALKMQHLERLRSNYEKEIEDATDPQEQIKLQRLITKVANLKVKMQTRPLDELFPGAPHELMKKKEDYNPFDAADYLSRMKKKK
jgi:DNA primase